MCSRILYPPLWTVLLLEVIVITTMMLKWICWQIELYIGLRDEEHVTFPIKGLTINSNADTLMLELPLHPVQTWGQESSDPVAVWCATYHTAHLHKLL